MAPKLKITPGEHEAIRRMAKAGTRVVMIARMYGVTRQAIYKIIWSGR